MNFGASQLIPGVLCGQWGGVGNRDESSGVEERVKSKVMAVLALPALFAAPPGNAETPLDAFGSAGVSSVASPLFPSLAAGVVWTPGGWPLLAEVQYDGGRYEITAVSVSVGVRWRISRAWRVSPLLVASGGVVGYRSAFGETVSGGAWSLGTGLEYRLSTRVSLFVEARINLWIGDSIGDGLDGTVPVRSGVVFRM